MKEILKIPSDKERARRAKTRGGFSDSYLDKKNLKKLGNTHRCKFCQKFLKPYAFNHKTGVLIMSCDTPDCIGNAALSRGDWRKEHKEIFARHIDRKLTFDMKHLMFRRHPGRLWSLKDRIF